MEGTKTKFKVKIKEKSKQMKTKEDVLKTAEKVSGRKPRELVVPGQILARGMGSLPGDGAAREGNNIIAIRFGLLEQLGRLIKVIPLSGAYIPKIGDVVIGRVIDITPSVWIINIASANSGMLGLAEGTREYVSRNADLSKYYAVGDVVISKVIALKPRNVELSMKGPGLKKLEHGLLVKINPNKVPRIIGKLGSMVNLIKNETNCIISVGQNGVIWVRGREVQSELLARDAIKFVEEFAHTEELTERVKKFLDKKRLVLKSKK